MTPVDSLKFKDSKYPDRLKQATEATGETDALVVMQVRSRRLPAVVACFSSNSWVARWARWSASAFARGVDAAIRASAASCRSAASGGARMQEGLASLMQMSQDHFAPPG